MCTSILEKTSIVNSLLSPSLHLGVVHKVRHALWCDYNDDDDNGYDDDYDDNDVVMMTTTMLMMMTTSIIMMMTMSEFLDVMQSLRNRA